MNRCMELTRDMLPNPIDVYTDEHPEFMTAKALAFHQAKQVSSDPMLMAWFDKGAARYSPDVICCDYEKPAWLVYAESRGADISVNVNDLDYVFVYGRSDMGD